MSRRVRINGAPSPPRERHVMRTRVSTDDPVEHPPEDAAAEDDECRGSRVGEGPDLTATERILLHQNKTGRPKGSQNRVTVVLKEAIMAAAEDVGEDGQGKGGVVGYMRRLAQHEPATFGSLLRRIMPVEVRTDDSPLALAILKELGATARLNGHGHMRVIEHRRDDD